MAYASREPGRLNWIAVLLTFIIGMTVGILTGFGIPFWYFVVILILFGILALATAMSKWWSPIGVTARSLMVHTVVVLAGIIFAYAIWTFRFFEPAFKLILMVILGG